MIQESSQEVVEPVDGVATEGDLSGIAKKETTTVV